MRILIALLLVFSASISQAKVIGSVGTSLAYEMDNNGRSYSTIQPWSVRGGYAFKLADVYLEYSQFESSQGTPAIQVGRLRQEILVWGKRVFNTGWKVRPFAAAALGYHIDTVNTNFGSMGRSDQGTADPMVAAAFGIQLRPTKEIEVNLEGRVAASQSFAPNPMMGFGLFMGFRL